MTMSPAAGGTVSREVPAWLHMPGTTRLHGSFDSPGEPNDWAANSTVAGQKFSAVSLATELGATLPSSPKAIPSSLSASG